MQNTWIFSQRIPPPFRIENKRTETAEQKVVVQTLASEEIDRPFVVYSNIQVISKDEIIAYIKTFSWDFVDAIFIFICESGLNPRAYNPETRAKELGITKYGSYGIAQINAPFNEELYDYKFNIDIAYELYLKRGWSPWKNCAVKNNLL